MLIMCYFENVMEKRGDRVECPFAQTRLGPFPPDKKASPGFGEAFSVPKAGLEPARLLKDIGF